MFKKMEIFIFNILKILFKILFTLLKLLLCIFFTLLVIYFVFIVNIEMFINKVYDLQIFLYDIVSIFAIFGIWINVFIKVKKRTVVIFTIIFTIWFLFLLMLPSVKKQIDNDSCIDSVNCSELY